MSISRHSIRHHLFVPIDALLAPKARVKQTHYRNMSWNTSATIATYLTLEDINRAASTLDVQHHATPVLKLVSEARAKGYNALYLPITTDKWKQRWTGMCIQSSDLEDHERDLVVERRTEEWRARPAFLKDEVTMTRLGQSLHQI